MKCNADALAPAALDDRTAWLSGIQRYNKHSSRGSLLQASLGILAETRSIDAYNIS
jgi:hypothetical protein